MNSESSIMGRCIAFRVSSQNPARTACRGFSMSRYTQQERRRTKAFGTAQELDQLLDNFQTLDRTVVDMFMQIYEMPAHRQSALRLQNRRLHAAISKPLRRILSHSTGISRKK